MANRIKVGKRVITDGIDISGYDDGELSNSAVKSLLSDFGAKSEDDLLQKLAKDAMTINCVDCGKEISIESADFFDGDPHCSRCA